MRSKSDEIGSKMDQMICSDVPETLLLKQRVFGLQNTQGDSKIAQPAVDLERHVATRFTTRVFHNHNEKKERESMSQY